MNRKLRNTLNFIIFGSFIIVRETTRKSYGTNYHKLYPNH